MALASRSQWWEKHRNWKVKRVKSNEIERNYPSSEPCLSSFFYWYPKPCVRLWYSVLYLKCVFPFHHWCCSLILVEDLPGGAVVKNLPPASAEMCVRSLGQKDPLEEEWQSAPVFLPGKFHGQRSLVDCSPWGCKESDTAEHTGHVLSACVCVLQNI